MEEILTIEIKPVWKKGTKITFPEKGMNSEALYPLTLSSLLTKNPTASLRGTATISLSPRRSHWPKL